MPVRGRLFRAVALPFALGLLALVSYVSYERVRDFENDVFWRGHTHDVLEHIERTQTALLGAESMRRAYRLTRDPKDRARMEEHLGASALELGAVEDLTKDNPSQQLRVAAVRPLIAERITILHEGLELPNWEELPQSVRDEQRARQTRGADLSKQTSLAVDAMRGEEQRLLEQRERRTITSAETTERTIYYGSGVGIFLVVLIYASFLRESRARERVQRDLARTNYLFDAVLRESTDVIAVKDTEGRYLLINGQGSRNLRRAPEDIVGKTDREVLTGGTGESVMAGDRKVLAAGRALTYEQVASVGDQTWTFHSTKSPFRGPDGELLGLIAVSRDITEKKHLEQQLQESLRAQAMRDALTGLYNRRYFDETLARELSRVGRREAPLSLVMVDVDHFKKLNDSAGHVAGDEVLRRVAQILGSGVRREDVACRYGGEEFALVLPELALDAAVERAERLRALIAEIPAQIGEDYVGRVTASFGVAAFPAHGLSGDALTKSADAALYAAKRAGRNRVVRAEAPTAVTLVPAPPFEGRIDAPPELPAADLVRPGGRNR
jgi:diguanylate cyclase (GGDEF)-like protein/PAS domain S-box-containing protein